MVQRSFINSSFESPVLPSDCWTQVNQAIVPGWNTNHPSDAPVTGACTGMVLGGTGPLIEIWRNYSNIIAPDGSQYVEMNARVASRLSQDVCLILGEPISYSFYHRGRNGNDTGRLLIGGQQIIQFRSGTTAGSGSILATTLGSASVASAGTWSHYTGSFVNNFTSGDSNIGFEAVSAAGGATQGNFLDHVHLEVVPFVEFRQATFSTPEGQAAGAPALFLAGDFSNDIEIFFRVIGGTANADDYRFITATGYTSHGSNLYSVIVPRPATPDAYANGLTVDLGLRPVLDAIAEPDETVQIELFSPMPPGTSPYALANTEVCGGSARTLATWTIQNASSALELEKTAELVDSNANGHPDSGDTIIYRFTVTNTGATALTDVTIDDPLLGTPISVGTLAAGASSQITRPPHTIIPANIDPATGEYPNTARAEGSLGGTPVTSAPDTAVVALNAMPAIELTKTANHDDQGAGLAAPGQRIAYTFAVTNSGNTTLTNIRLSDPLLGWTDRVLPGPLAPGATVAYTTTSAESHVITPADIAAGRVDNTATVRADSSRPLGGPEEVSQTASDGVDLTVMPRLILNKTASPSSGRTIIYTFTIGNDGSVPVSDIEIDDAMFPDPTVFGCVGVAYPVPALDPGDTVACTATHELTDAEILLTAVTNTARARGQDPGGALVSSPVSSVVVSTPAIYELELDKTSTTTVINQLGQSVDYTVTATNRGNRPLTTVTVSDDRLSPATRTCAPLAVGASCELTGSYITVADDLRTLNLVNTATATSSQIAQPVTATHSLPVLAADLTISKTLDDTSPGIGAEVIFTLVATNDGPSDATGVTVADQLPAGYTHVSDSSGGDYDPATGNWTIGALANGASRAVTITARVNAAGPHVNTATVTGDQGDPDLSNNTDSVTPTLQFATLTVVKQVDQVQIDAPGDVAYTVLVENTGGVAIPRADLVLDDTLTIGSVTTSLALTYVLGDDGDDILDPGETWSYETLYSVTQANIDAGDDLSNIVAVSAQQLTGPITSPPAVTRINAASALRVSKVADVASVSAPQRINYVITVENSGTTSIAPADLVVSDRLTTASGPVALNPVRESPNTGDVNGNGVFDPGETWIYVTSYDVVQADIDARLDLVNVATAAVPAGQNPIAPVDSPDATVAIDVTPGLVVTKTAQHDGADLVHYRVEVRNSGGVSLNMVAAPVDSLTTLASQDARELVLSFDASESTGGASATLIPVGAVQVWTASHRLTQSDVDAGGVRNTVLASALPPNGSDPADLITAGDTVETLVAAEPGLSVVKTVQAHDEGSPGQVGDPVIYRYEVSNSGNVTLTGVRVTEAGGDFSGTNGLPVPVWLQSSMGSPDGTLLPGEVALFSAEYRLSAADLDAGELVNIAAATGLPPNGQTPVTDRSHPSDPGDSGATILTLLRSPALQLEIFVDETRDVNGDGLIGEGDQVVYRFEVINTGNVTLTGVNLLPASLSLNFPDLICQPVTLAPGERAVLSCVGAAYRITAADVAAGQVTLTGDASGTSLAGIVVSASSTAPVVTAEAVPPGIEVEKLAGVQTAMVGDLVPYTIRVRNVPGAASVDVALRDTLPPGFLYREGSARLDGVAVSPVVQGGRLALPSITVASGQSRVLTLQVLVGSSVRPGAHVNRVRVTDAVTGALLAPEATATVRVLADAVLQCATVLGRVFDDVDQNGDMSRQAEERGLPNVRLVAPNGVSIVTDEHGRFNVPCAAMPRAIGANFMLKLDERTLPVGYRMTTENPRVVRLTPGMITRMDFGATLARLVRIDLAANAFIRDANRRDVMVGDLEIGLRRLVAEIRDNAAMLRITYVLAPGESENLARQRLRLVTRALRNLWTHEGRYKLNIETLVQRAGERR